MITNFNINICQLIQKYIAIKHYCKVQTKRPITPGFLQCTALKKLLTDVPLQALFPNIYQYLQQYLSLCLPVSLVTFFHLILLYTDFSQHLTSLILVQPTGSVNVISYFRRSHFLFKHCFPSVHSLAIYWYANNILLAQALRTFLSPPPLSTPLNAPSPSPSSKLSLLNLLGGVETFVKIWPACGQN